LYNLEALLSDVPKWEGEASHLALIAGEGTLPFNALQEAKRQGYKVFVFLIHGRPNDFHRYRQIADGVMPYHLGQLRKMLAHFRDLKITHVCFAGKVNKWLLFTQLNFDGLSLRLLKHMPRKNDDALMRYIIEAYAHLGIETVPQVQFMQSLFQAEGVIAEGKPLSEADWLDACFGFDTAKSMAALDIGQSVVVNDTMVIAVEAIEGTDECIKRAGHLQRKQGGCLAKVAKPAQDARFDVPAVGLRTLKRMHQAGLSLLVTEANATLFLDALDTMQAFARKHGITILSVSGDGLAKWRTQLEAKQFQAPEAQHQLEQRLSLSQSQNSLDSSDTIQHLLICTGDPSAATHASALVKHIKAQAPLIQISAVGNDTLKNAGAELVAHHDEIGMGGWGIASALMGIWGHFRLAQRLKRFVQTESVDRVLLVDYGGFHLKLAELLFRDTDIRYYIPPQLWASRPHRIKSIERFITKVYTIFPFENNLYASVGIPFQFVGHPLLQALPSAVSKADFCTRHSLDVNAPLVGLFPGSRKGEIERLLPVFAEALALLKEKHPTLQVVIAQAPNIQDAYLENVLEKAFQHTPELLPKTLKHENHAVLSASDVILGASGTTSLESALYGTPMVIAYQVDAISAFVAKRLITVPFIGLPNLLVPREMAPIFPEHLQDACTADLLAEAVSAFLDAHSPESQKAQAGFAFIQSSLGEAMSLEAFAQDVISL
jgi:lipid-A-disaccharide synthase